MATDKAPEGEEEWPFDDHARCFLIHGAVSRAFLRFRERLDEVSHASRAYVYRNSQLNVTICYRISSVRLFTRNERPT